MNRTEMDYYAVLNVPRDATKEQITLAYRNLAIKLIPCRDAQHERDFMPTANPEEPTHLVPLSKERQWEYINMAYDVLGNELHRNVYDRYGEAGLFEGVLLPHGYFPPYQYHGDAMRIYLSVFGSYSPFANLIDAVTNPPVLYSTREHGIGLRRKDPPKEMILNLKLEDVRKGCVKLIAFWRRELVGKTGKMEKKKTTLTVTIQPGTTENTHFTFKEAGDQHPTSIPADVVVITADEPHPIFKRVNQCDLLHTHKISISEALTGFRYTIETLDKRKLTISITDVVKPGYVKVLPGEGLPKCAPISHKVAPKRIAKCFGDLIIEFEVIFPDFLNNEMKMRVRSFFREFDEMEKQMLANQNA